MNNPVQHPLPEGVHDYFTYTCILCGGTVTVVESTAQPHECRVSDKAKAYYGWAEGGTLTAKDLLGIAPDFTGGLSVDEYMDEQRGRGEA